VDVSRVLSAEFDGSTPYLRRGVVLASGTAFPVEQIARGEKGKVRLTREGGTRLDLAPADLATIVFDASGPLVFPPGDTPGALLTTGDFFEGDLISLHSSRLTLGSTLFGERDFDIERELTALRLRRPASPRDGYVVRLADGTVARTSALRAERGRLSFDDAVVGALSAVRDDVREVRLASDVLVPLLAPGARAVLRSNLPARLRGVAAWGPRAESVVLAPGSDLTIDLPEGATAVLLRAGLPSALLPTARYRVEVFTDGVRAFRGNPLTSLDDPQTLTLPVTGRKQLTLRLDAPAGTEVIVTDAVAVRGPAGTAPPAAPPAQIP
jgi:hypothetical protein